MAPMQFTDLTETEKNMLQDTARKSIAYGQQYQHALAVDVEKYSELLQTTGASFVTLNINNQLRGCIGTLQAHQALIADVSEHAFSAAFKDPRFPPVTENELSKLDIHISILTPAEPMSFKSETDLLAQLQPGVDGLILEDDFHKATFLPSVWEQLPEAEDFLNHLKQKAGLGMHDWPQGIRISRYMTISI